MFVAAYEEYQNIEDIEHVCYANIVSYDEDKDEVNPKKYYTPKGPTPLFKPVSFYGNLRTTNVREENVRDLASPGTKLPTQPPAYFVLANIEEDNLSSESPQEELM